MDEQEEQPRIDSVSDFSAATTMTTEKDNTPESAAAVSGVTAIPSTTPPVANESPVTFAKPAVGMPSPVRTGSDSFAAPMVATASSTAPNTKLESNANPRESLNDWGIGKTLTAKDVTETLKSHLAEYDAAKEKIGKLKSLLGRSAKAQREAKVELEATQKRLDHALKEIDRLNQKIDKLANRPTHMELLADFETNFDRALLSVGQQQQQAGGQDTAPPASAGGDTVDSVSNDKDDIAVVDGLLMQELNESRQRIEKLEGLNAALVQRSSQLEKEVKEQKHHRDEMASMVSRLELEKRMAVMEAEHASKAMQEKAASLEEMQLEIDLLTKASVNANARAAQGVEMIKSVKTDKQHVQQLESKVQALQEWALASSEAKNLAQERVRFLEQQLQTLQHGSAGASTKNPFHRHSTKKIPSSASSDDGTDDERILFYKHGSFVVGAGDIGVRSFHLKPEDIKSLKLSERVLLRWKFDLTQEDATIEFSILQKTYDNDGTVDPQVVLLKKRNRVVSPSDYLIKDRNVKAGAAGETENAFAVNNSCTLLWSNVKSWIRPKTVKYDVEAVVVSY